MRGCDLKSPASLCIRYVMLFAVLVSCLPGTALGQKPLPRSIDHPDGLFLWRAATEVISEDGVWLTDNFPSLPPAFREEIDRGIRARKTHTGPVSDCMFLANFGMDYANHVVLEPRSFRQVVRIAEAVFAGTVVSSESGWGLGNPGVMLGIQVSAWLKTGDGYRADDKVYVFYPGAAIKLGPLEICAGGRYMPPPPRPGDSVLVLPQFPPEISRDPIILMLIERAVEIIFDRGGRITSSDAMLSLPDLEGMQRLPQVVRHAQSVLGRAGR